MLLLKKYSTGINFLSSDSHSEVTHGNVFAEAIADSFNKSDKLTFNSLVVKAGEYIEQKNLEKESVLRQSIASTVFVIKPVKSSNKVITSLFDKRGEHAMASINNTLVIAGGRNDRDDLADVWASYDSGKTWTQLHSSAPFGKRSAHAMASINNTLVIAGG